MARYRLSAPAKTDIASILRTSETMHGIEARIRYRALLVHVIFYRALSPGLIEIVRVLHERMEPGRHIGAARRAD